MRLSVLFSVVLPLVLPLPAASLAAESSSELPAELDPISAQCMECHDGSEGNHIRLCFLPQVGTACGSHVVSADYVDLADRKWKDLKPAGALPAELVLHEGLITCVTCHGEDPHLGDPLAMNNLDSALCRACHRR